MSDAVGTEGLVPLVRHLGADGPLFLDVLDLSLGADLAVPATHAATGHRLEPEQSDQTHCPLSKSPCNRHARHRVIDKVAIRAFAGRETSATAAAMDRQNNTLDHFMLQLTAAATRAASN